MYLFFMCIMTNMLVYRFNSLLDTEFFGSSDISSDATVMQGIEP